MPLESTSEGSKTSPRGEHVAFYAGSFDPPTRGHVDIIERALRLSDRLVVGIGVNHAKAPLFSIEERLVMLRECLSGRPAEVVTFSGLVVDAARQAGAKFMVRGLRDGTDFDYEAGMAGMNATLAPALETVFLAASPELRPISATLVRQIAAMGGDTAPFLPPSVQARLVARFARP